MVLTDAIAVIKPEPDSHFKLLPCPECKSDNVAYVGYMLGVQEPWRVQCFDCGHTVDKQTIFRHNAQRHWNEEARCLSGKVVPAYGGI